MIFNMVLGGSGGGMDIDVVGGLTQPSALPENTIWIKTEQTIGNIYLSPSAPESPSEGDIWVQTLGVTVCTMTLSDDPLVQLPINSFSIYVGGVWTHPGGCIQCEGVLYDLTVRTYGIMRSLTASSPLWTRMDDSANFTATASVGVSAGHSDFDEWYPWSGIKRETLSTGDVMVKIPKFWYRRYRDDENEYIQIADAAKEGFSVHPAFTHNNAAQEYIYVGAYKTNSSYKSTSGSEVFDALRVDHRTGATAKGTGWGLIDISTVSAIQMLYLVEFANNDSQAAVGKGYAYSEPSDGQKPIVTGTTDSVANLTGRASGTDGKTDVVYRGIEGFWGNDEEGTDGINLFYSRLQTDSYPMDFYYYYSNDQSIYAELTVEGYTKLPLMMPNSGGLIKSLCCLSEYPFLFLTEVVSVVGHSYNDDYYPFPIDLVSSNTYCCDYGGSANHDLKYNAFHRGGYYLSLDYAGIFTSGGMSGTYVVHKGGECASRLLYIPAT